MLTTHPRVDNFTGKEKEQESGSDDFGARYNSSNVGRSAVPDPWTLGRENRYRRVSVTVT
jgi:hypothetical protein